jgi:hypothetical protein
VHPLAAEQTFLLEPVQRWIHGALRVVEAIVARAANVVDDRVAVQRSTTEGGEQKHVEVTGELFPRHTSTV